MKHRQRVTVPKPRRLEPELSQVTGLVSAHAAARSLRLSPAWIVAAAVIIFFLPVLFGNYTLIPQNPGEVFSGAASEQGLGYHTADPVGSFTELSYGRFLRQTIHSGHIPFWSPFQALGHPFLADTLFSALFAPATALRLLLPSTHWGLICVLNVLLASLSIYALALEYGCMRRPAVVGAITYLALGTTVLYAPVFSVACVTAWAPLLILGIERLAARPAGNRKLDYGCAIAGAYGVITGGHVTITLLTVLLAGLYSATRLVQLQSRASVKRLALAAGIAILLTAVHWLPLAEYATYRGNTYADFSHESFSPRDLPAYFVPYIYGRLNEAHTETNPPVDIHECWSLGWLPPGILPLLMAGASFFYCRRSSKTAPFALALAAGVMGLWAFGVAPFHLFSRLPFMNRVRPSYIPVTVGFVLCLIAAIGFHRIEEGAVRLRAVAGGTLAVLAAVIAGGGALLLSQKTGGAEAGGYLLRHASYPLLWAAVALIALAAGRRPDRYRLLFAAGVGLPLFSVIAFFPWASTAAISRAWGGALGCFIAAVVVGYFYCARGARVALGAVAAAALASRSWVMAAPHHLPAKHDLFQLPAYAEFLQRHIGAGYRAYGLDGFLFPNLSSAYQIATPNRVTAIVTPQDERFYHRYLDAFQSPEQFSGLDLAGPDGTPVSEFHRNRRFWDYIGVRYVVSQRGATDLATFREGTWLLNGTPGHAAESVSYGKPGDLPIVGDWNGDGRPKPGIFRAGLWILDWNGNKQWDTSDAAHVIHFGLPGDVPVIGDWSGDGRPKIGVFRQGLWVVDWNGNGKWDATDAEHIFRLGGPGDIPVTGDWNGDGRLKAGVFRDGEWMVDWDGQLPRQVAAAPRVFRFGSAGDRPLIGDWNGDGRLKVGVFRSGAWLLDWNGNGQWDETDAGHQLMFGSAGDIPLVWSRASATTGSALTAAFEDRARHALVWQNNEAQMRAYVASGIGSAGDWQEAQDRFAAQTDLRKIAFVEPGVTCGSNQALPGEAGRVLAIRMQANRVEIDADTHAAGMLVLVDAFMPGWTARVDGKPSAVVRVNGTFRGACIQTEGRHHVSMDYEPPHWHLAAGLSFAGALMLIGLGLAPIGIRGRGDS